MKVANVPIGKWVVTQSQLDSLSWHIKAFGCPVPLEPAQVIAHATEHTILSCLSKEFLCSPETEVALYGGQANVS